MTDQQYNNLFRSKLNDFSSGYPEQLWQSIQQEKDEKDNQVLAAIKYIVAVFFLILAIKTNDRLVAPDKDIAILHTAKTLAKINVGSSTLQQTKELNPTSDKANYLSLKPASSGFAFVTSANNKKKKRQSWFLKKNDFTNGIHQHNSSIQLTNETVNNDGKNGTDSVTNKVGNDALQTLKKKAQKQADSAEDITIHNPGNSEKWFLYLFASPDIALAHVRSDNAAYQQVRNKETTMQFSYTAGARFRINLTSRFSGNIGIQYSQVNEKIKRQNSTSNNRYKSVDVPLIAGYRIYKNKWEIDADAGIILNLSSSYSGYISSISNEPVDIHQQNVYRSNTSLSYYGGLQFLFKPGKRLSVFAEPYFKYQPGNIAGEFQPFQEHVQKAGILLGARYRLYK